MRSQFPVRIGAATRITLFFLLLAFFLPAALLAQEGDDPASGGNSQGDQADSDSQSGSGDDELKGLNFTYVPLPSYSSDDGFGMGLRVYATNYREGIEPYDYQVFGQAYWTTGGVEYHVLSLDVLDFAGTPFRVKMTGGFDRYLNAQYYGIGNRHDIERQNDIIEGKIPVQSNIPETRDFYQVNDEITLNENFITNPSRPYLNPGRRVLRESQNKYYNYDRIRPFYEASTEDFLWNTNFKWFAGFRIQHYRIQSYEGDYENGNSVPNTKTLIDIEQPMGYETVHNPGWVNTVRAAVAYDSRPRMREKNPNEGVFTDLHVETAGHGTGSQFSFTRVTYTFRHYIDLFPGFFRSMGQEFVFAYRFMGQETFGNAPFYELGIITSMVPGEWNEGLGGKKGLRGYANNQYVDRVMAMGNVEFRYTLARYKKTLGGVDVLLVGYYDVGRVAHEKKELSFEDMHSAAGGGLRLVWQRNTIINLSYGRSRYGSNLNFSFDHPF